MLAKMDTATALKASLALTDAPRLPPRKFSFESPREYRKRVPHALLAQNRRDILATIKDIRWCLDWFEYDYDGDDTSNIANDMDDRLRQERARLQRLLAERRALRLAQANGMEG
jgi:hypothetical protein